MGGVQKFEAYNTVRSYDSGKYELKYLSMSFFNKLRSIDKIILDEPLVERAKRDPNISKYMDKNGVLILKNEITEGVSKNIMEAFKTENTFLIQKAYNEIDLTKGQCQKILDWICDR